MPPSPTKPDFHTTPSRSSTSIYSSTANANTFNNGTSDFSISTFEHISPTKALFQSRVNNDITSLTAWLETLHAPASGSGSGSTPASISIPKYLLKWRDEVQQASSQFNVGIVGGALGHPPSMSSSGGIAADSSNDDGSKILEALKALKQANLLADHLRTLLYEARAEELEDLESKREHVAQQREQRVPSRVCVDEVYAGLSGDAKMAAEELESVAVLLKLPVDLSSLDVECGCTRDGNANGSGCVEEAGMSDLMSIYSHQVLDQAHLRFTLDEQIERLHKLLQDMWTMPDRAEVAADFTSRVDASRKFNPGTSPVVEDTDIANDAHTNEQLQVETAGFLRDTKQVNLKILEYQDRINGLHRQLSRLRAESVSLEDILNLRKQVDQRSNNIEELEQRIRRFHGLAPDLTASRNEIKRAAFELEGFKRKREDLFERISNVER